MNKQELIGKIKSAETLYLSLTPFIEKKLILDLVKQLDEPQRVKVPQCVGDFITEQKKLGHTLSYSIDACMSDRVAEWYWDNSELFALAWIFGYKVKKEKRYRVKMKNAYYNKYPQFLCETDNGIFWAAEIDLRKTKFTRKELEQAGFGWVFDCEGIEVEEMEG